ncbi:hypothetical protein MKW98_026949 [Papaver atlanticum]|uniref:Uncharacterized protein n=1 Tax=Papaver atlanticum TaxID=357466 RepID=A0AAD4SVE2_9MAGN|nr:hypothetical protein MKW98_026949 [Papaver atlanticum]
MVHRTASELLSGSEILENNGESTTQSKPWKEARVSRRSYEDDTTPYPLQSGYKKNPYFTQVLTNFYFRSCAGRRKKVKWKGLISSSQSILIFVRAFNFSIFPLI